MTGVTGVWYITYMDIEAIANTVNTDTFTIGQYSGTVLNLTIDIECECGQRQFHEVEEAEITGDRYVGYAVIPEDIRCGNCGDILYNEGDEHEFIDNLP